MSSQTAGQRPARPCRGNCHSARDGTSPADGAPDAHARHTTHGRTLALHPDRLTAREVAVLRLLASGSSNAEIAAALVLSPKTIERHLANIYAKIGARNRVEATAYAGRHGLL